MNDLFNKHSLWCPQVKKVGINGGGYNCIVPDNNGTDSIEDEYKELNGKGSLPGA